MRTPSSIPYAEKFYCKHLYLRPDVCIKLEEISGHEMFAFNDCQQLILLSRHSRFTLEFPGSLWNGYTAYTEKLLCTLKIISTNHKLYV